MMMVSKHHASSVGFPDSGGVGGVGVKYRMLHIPGGDRSISSGILRISEENRRKQIPGLVPRTAQWLAYLQR